MSHHADLIALKGTSYRIKHPGIVIHIDVTTFDNISDGGGWRPVD
ncbi:hypothetical protein [Rhodococcus triatomae]